MAEVTQGEEQGGVEEIRMKKQDHADFKVLIHKTSAEFFTNKEAKRFREIVKTYFAE